MKTLNLSTLGQAMFWQTIQYSGEKFIFLIRLVVLAKLLSPYDFGLLAIASLAINVLMRISNFGMTTALVQLEDASQDHYDSAWTADLFRAVAISFIIYLSSPIIAKYTLEPGVTNLLRVLAIRPIIDASASIMIARFSRNLNFRSLVFLQLPKALTNTCLSILLARQFGVWAVVVGTLAGSFVFMVQSYVLAPHKPRLLVRIDVFKPLVRFGRWIFLAGIVVMSSQIILRVVISRQLGTAELGLYYLAASIAFIPTDIANQIVGAVAFPYFSRLQNNIQESTNAFKSILITVTVFLLPVTALMITLAPTLINDVFGSNWKGTENIIRILVIVNIFDVLGETIIPILNGNGHPDKILILETVQSFVSISAVWSLTRSYGVVGAASAWLPATIISQILGVYLLRGLLNKPFSHLQIPILTVGVVSIAGALLAFGIDFVIPGWIGFFLASLTGLSLIGIFLWKLESRYSLGLFEGIQRAFPRIAGLMGLKPLYEISHGEA